MKARLGMVALLLALLPAGTGCDLADKRAEVVPADSTVHDPPMPERVAAVIRDSPTITACLTKGQQLFTDGVAREPAIYLGGPVWYPIRSPFITLTEGQAARLRALLLDLPRSGGYLTDCIFQADVAFRFATPGDSLRVLVCQSCGELKVAAPGSGWGCLLVDRHRPLLDFTQELFPGDARLERIRGELGM